MIPNDPVMLLSFLNMKLRDQYKNLSLLCEDLQIDRSEIEEKMNRIQYQYDEKQNQFR